MLRKLFCIAVLTLAMGASHWIATSIAQPKSQAAAPPTAGDGQKTSGRAQPAKRKDAKNQPTGKAAQPHDPDLEQFAIYEKTAPRGEATEPVSTALPLSLRVGDRIALVGNTLFDRAQHFGYFETLLHQHFSQQQLKVRNLSWSADEISLQPRPANFADVEQHLRHEQASVIIAAFGFNESFAGEAGLPEFRRELTNYLSELKSKTYDGQSAPRVVLISPIANENVPNIPAADLNNKRLALYTAAMQQVAAEQQVGFVDVFTDTGRAMSSIGTELTINGCHLNEEGYKVFARTLFRGLFDAAPPDFDEAVRQFVLDKSRQYSRRYRPLNSFYYTGGRNKTYGYLDFLPAMRNFDMMVANREDKIAEVATGPSSDTTTVDDSDIPPLPDTLESRGANRWMSADDELKAFDIDPRFEVNLFAGEEEFPDIAAPIQMRWDAQGRLWVSCSTTYPHVYPGNEPNDKIVVLEDTDGDGRADKSTVFAEDLHIPLSFEFGDGGVYVSEMPDLTFLKDTDGDGRADVRRRLLTGFGTEDSHHALHDMTWTPDGDLLFRESIFHHSQVETPYGPVRQRDSGWCRFTPKTQRLISFGTYYSTNPWGVTFDDWGQHVASHPIYAAAFHSLDPPYPAQHPKPAGLRAYSGTCGQEFVDFATFPDELQGHFLKARYKPTNRIEIHKWVEGPYGYDEQYVGDVIFSRNLSFIPVDIRYGPRGAMYVCDWYNPVKGHAQYSLRDERRDRHSGRIWRITAKGRPLAEPPTIADATIESLLALLKRPEYRIRYWAKREFRDRDPQTVKEELDRWVASLDAAEPRYRHHQLEAVWLYRGIDEVNTPLLRELLACDDHRARAAATQQLRYWHAAMPDAQILLRTAANDANGIVRMQAAIAASYVGDQAALDAVLDTLKHPHDGHLRYAITCALGSHTLRRHWETGDSQQQIARLLEQSRQDTSLKEPNPSAKDAQFDLSSNLKRVEIGCIPERMRFTVEQFDAKPGQPVKLVFRNPDATDHNLLIVQPGAMAEVGMAANEMAKDPKNANSNFHPKSKRDLILQASPMIGPTRKSRVHVLRFHAPTEPGIYPYVCTFPGHWVIMNGVMVVADTSDEAARMLAEAKPKVVREWKMSDFASLALHEDEATMMQGYQAFAKAGCNQCHVHSGHGVNLGPELTKVCERLKGLKLLQQILEPSSEIHKEYQPWTIVTDAGKVVTGVIKSSDEQGLHVITNLLLPDQIETIPHRDIEFRKPSSVSPMPNGLANVLTRKEIEDLVSFLQHGGYKPPPHLEHQHHQHSDESK